MDYSLGRKFSQIGASAASTASISHNFDSRNFLRIEPDLMIPITSCSAQFGTGNHPKFGRQAAPHPRRPRGLERQQGGVRGGPPPRAGPAGEIFFVLGYKMGGFKAIATPRLWFTFLSVLHVFGGEFEVD